MAKRSTRKPAARGSKKVAKSKKAKAAPKKAAPKKAKKAAPKKKAAPSRAKAPRPSSTTGTGTAAAASSPRPPGPPGRRIESASPEALARARAATSISRLVWLDLMAKDPAKASGFYASVLGWMSKDANLPPGQGSYTMLSANGEDFGGVAPQQDSNMPAAWVSYFRTDKAKQLAHDAEKLGGRVLVPVTEIPNVGRFAIIADPTGGVFGTLELDQEPKPAPTDGNLFGPVHYTELMTDKPERALAFFDALFGWTHVTLSDPAFGPYHVFMANGQVVAGCIPRPPFLPANVWLTYFLTPDVDVANQVAVDGGSTQLIPPMAVPGLGRFSWLLDPQGALFGLFRHE